MKLNIKKELLIKAVGATEKNIGKNLTLPILNNILIKTNKNSLQITSTDLELATIVEIPAKIEQGGSVVVQPRALAGFLNNSPHTDVQLSINKNSLNISQKDYKTTIKGQEDSDFPLLPKTDKKKFFTVNSKVLTTSLNQVISSTSTSDLKLELTGVFFDIDKDNIKLAATDSFRLAEKKITRDKAESVSDARFILPSKSAQEIIRNYQNLDDVLFFYVDLNQITVQNEENKNFNIKTISKIIEGEYPEYSQIIPKEYSTTCIVSKKEFTQQVKGASLFASRINDIELKLENNRISIHSQNNDIGEFKSSIEAAIEGEEQLLRFNFNYLLSGLNNIEGDEIIFKVSKTDGPTLLGSTKHKNYLYIIMPIRK